MPSSARTPHKWDKSTRTVLYMELSALVPYQIYLKGLAMIFADQENPLIIFRSKETKQITKSP